MSIRRRIAISILLTAAVATFSSAYLFSPLESQLERQSTGSDGSPKMFSGSPPLLQSLAAKEGIIYEILKTFAASHLPEDDDEVPTDFVDISRILTWVQLQIGFLFWKCLHWSVSTRYLAYYEDTTKALQSDHIAENNGQIAQLVSWNLVASYHMINRFTRDLKEILKSLDESHQPSLRKLFSLPNITYQKHLMLKLLPLVDLIQKPGPWSSP